MQKHSLIKKENINAMQKITATVFYALIALSMAVFALNPVHAPPIPDAVGSMMMAFGILAAVIVGLAATWRTVSIPTPWPVFSFVGLGLAAFVSGLANKGVFWQTYGPTNLIWLFGAVALASALAYAGQVAAAVAHPERGVRWIGGAVVAAGIVTVIIEMIQIAKPGFSAGGLMDAMPASLTPYGNLMQRNHAAALLGLALLFVAYFAHEGRAWRHSRGAGFAAAALLTLGIVLTASRVGLAYVVLGGGFFGLLSAEQGQPPRLSRMRAARWAVFGLLAGAIAYVVMVWLEPSLVSPHGISAASRFEGAGMAARNAIWAQAWAMFRTHPIFGAGWGSFSAFALAGALTSSKAQFVNNAHDIVLQILAETGLVGLMLAGLPLALSVWYTLRQGSAWFAPAWRKLAVAVCLLIGGYSLVEYPLWSPLFLAPFALFLGMASAPSPVGGRVLTFGTKIAGLALAALALVVLIPAMAQYRAISSDTLMSTVPGVLQSSGFNARAMRANSALPLFEPEIEFLEFQSMPVNGVDVDARIALGNRVAMHYTTPATLEKLAALYIVKGDAMQAAARMAVVARMYPKMAPDVTVMLREAAQAGNPVAVQAMRVYDKISMGVR